MPRIAIRNPDRTVLIDDTYDNLVLHSKGSVFKKTPALGETYSSQFEVSIPMLGGRPPSIAIRCVSNDTTMHIMQSRIVGSNYVITILWEPVIPNGQDATLYWYAFYPVSKKSTGTGDVILRNRSTGLVTFDSGLSYLRVKEVVSGTAARTIAYPSDRVYAAMLMRVQYVVVTDNVYLEHVEAWRWYADWDIMGARWSGNNLTLKTIHLRQVDEGMPGAGGGTWRRDGYSFLVLDVTDF